MSLLQKFAAAAGSALGTAAGSIVSSFNVAAFDGRTEGWERGPDRRRPVAKLESNDATYNLGHREEMMAEARALCQTFGIANNILGKFANYCVSTCEVDFFTGDPTWDEQAEAFIKDRFATIDVCGEHNFPSMAKLAIKSAARDGDIGFIKTMDSGFPQLQAIEADRIRNNAAVLNIDTEKNFIGGVRRNRIGRPIFYRVWERQQWMGFETPHDIPAESFILLKDPQRFDGVRGITWFERGALNHMRDMKEIVAAEKGAVKDNGKLSIFWTKLSGGKPVSTVNLFGTKDDGSSNIYSEERHNNTNFYGLPGEGAHSHESNRPSPAWQGFMEFLIRDIAISLELPLGFVWAMLGTGPAVRLDSTQAGKTFSAKIDWLERQFFNPVIGWLINWGMQTGKLKFNPNWHRYECNRPAHPTIDVGRESKADLDELDACVTCEIDLAAMRGDNAFKVMKKKVRFAKELIDEAAKSGVPIEMLVSRNRKMEQPTTNDPRQGKPGIEEMPLSPPISEL